MLKLGWKKIKPRISQTTREHKSNGQTFPCWLCSLPRNSRGGKRSPPWRRPPSGIQPGLHERHQLHQRLLHRAGADGQDPPHGRDPQAAAARHLPGASPHRRHSRGNRDPHRVGKTGREIPCWRGRARHSPAEVGSRQRAALHKAGRGQSEAPSRHAPVVAERCC